MEILSDSVIPMGGRGRKKRGGARGGAAVTSRASTPLPSRYEFIPATSPPPLGPTNGPTHVRDYPPPMELFQNSQQGAPESQPPPQPRRSEHSQTRFSPSPQHRLQEQSHRQHSASPQSQHQGASGASSFSQNRASPLFQEGGNSPHSQQAHSDGEEAAFQEPSDEEYGDVNLSEDQLSILNALLTKPGREAYTTVLSPIEKPGTTWFGRDKSSLTRKITKVFTNKFDGPFYSWSRVPRDRQERYFIEFAKTHTWDPLITGVVQEKFESICKSRMKDMVSTVRTSRVQPNWIGDTLWEQMTAYWDTEKSKDKSSTTSAARLSERGGLGPHVHFSGQKSYLQIQQEMEEELGRPVSLGEVFIRTHTKKDGSYVDGKAKRVAETYQKNLEAKLSALNPESSDNPEGTSPRRELTVEEQNDLFLQSTIMSERGVPYGVGSLSHLYVNGKRKYPGSSASYGTLQEQLQQAQHQIELQAAENARREAEFAKASAAQEAKIEKLTMVERYLTQTDPRFNGFLASQTPPSTIHAAKSTTQQPDDPPADPTTHVTQTSSTTLDV
ncbi:uncharacterized protein LOC112083097 [Eutrema salsugineum]|uniref:uncharacterized protein LOC112083097 n=1 Tax=Eutrema salsugineum TaxID=72664 RepID=UPI000CED0F45|nr:uncharacterized protein LOC112083097 [Eutrema salsugineum]